MATFSIDFQRSHDIDWFGKINHTFIHALSFGGLLPEEGITGKRISLYFAMFIEQI